MWCKTCNDWELFVRRWEKDSAWICKECKTPHEPILLKDIPEEKITEQRERYKESQKRFFPNLYSQFIAGVGLNSIVSTFNSSVGSNIEIMEDDAGQMEIDEQERQKRHEEWKKEKEKKEALQKEYARYKNLGRNDICLCGSGKKYKKCCSYKYENL
jgi:hypothetical protein